MATWPTIPAQPSAGTAATSAWADAVIQALQVFNSPSTAYTPVWTGTTTNPVIGNGTINGYYWQFGKLVIGSFRVVPGSTTTYGAGNYVFTLPTTVAARYGSDDILGTGSFRHISTAVRYSLEMLYNTGGTIAPLYLNVSSNPVPLSATAPVVPASGDFITGAFVYEST